MITIVRKEMQNLEGYRKSLTSMSVTLSNFTYCSEFTVCRCDSMGSTSKQCNANGTCNCKPYFMGSKCNECEYGYQNCSSFKSE